MDDAGCTDVGSDFVCEGSHEMSTGSSSVDVEVNVGLVGCKKELIYDVDVEQTSTNNEQPTNASMSASKLNLLHN